MALVALFVPRLDSTQYLFRLEEMFCSAELLNGYFYYGEGVETCTEIGKTGQVAENGLLFKLECGKKVRPPAPTSFVS